jgi:hypothetical protein
MSFSTSLLEKRTTYANHKLRKNVPPNYANHKLLGKTRHFDGNRVRSNDRYNGRVCIAKMDAAMRALITGICFLLLASLSLHAYSTKTLDKLSWVGAGSEETRLESTYSMSFIMDLQEAG